MDMKLEDFNYQLPKELIAQHPLEKRDESRLLVVDRRSRNIEHKKFHDLLHYVKDGDLLVVNNARVKPARLLGKRGTGGKAEILLLDNIDVNIYKALIKPRPKIKEGDVIYFDEKKITATVLKKGSSENIVLFKGIDNIERCLREIGITPLPPYIKREATERDRERYQTIYAEREVAVASPTAGLHFTDELMKMIVSKGATFASVTLNVGYDTFRPVRDIYNHRMHSEVLDIPIATANLINSVKRGRGKIVGIGTTVCRTLESMYNNGRVKHGSNRTDLFIKPPYEFKVIDSLVTNFHLPRTSLIMLVSAFVADTKFLLDVYREAVKERYRFYSYGDAMLIL